jgi:hypothetical protein
MKMLTASAVADRFIFDLLKANTSGPKTKSLQNVGVQHSKPAWW